MQRVVVVAVLGLGAVDCFRVGSSPGARRGRRAAASREESYESREESYDKLAESGVDRGFLDACVNGIVSSVIASYSGERTETFNGEARLEVSAAESRLRRIIERRIAVGEVKAGNPKRAERRALAYARLASWTGGGCDSSEWVNSLTSWDPKEAGSDDDLEDALISSLAVHLMEKYGDAPRALRCSLWHPVTSDLNAGQRTAWRFFVAYRGVADGQVNVRRALQDAGLTVTKTAAKTFSEIDDTKLPFATFVGGSLHLWRRALVESIGGEEWVGEAACRSAFGLGVETPDLEEFLSLDALGWVCRNSEDLAEPAEAAACLDFFREMRRADPEYSTAGRTVKKVTVAREALELSTVKFAEDEAFLPNPRGLRPLILTDVTIPKTVVKVPYDDFFNGGHGPYKMGEDKLRGSLNHTIRIEEVLSLKRLIYEGKALNNCLETAYGSQVKYVTRARQRVSSFWSFTIAEQDQKPKHVLLLEVWHLREGDIVRQAEGPRPRTLPPPEAWYWAGVWCKKNKVDLSTWDHYSRLEAILPSPPYC